MNKVQEELNSVSRENELLKESREQDPFRPPPIASEDPLAEQVLHYPHLRIRSLMTPMQLQWHAPIRHSCR